MNSSIFHIVWISQLDQDTWNSSGDSVSDMDIKGWSRAPDIWARLSLEFGNDFGRKKFGEHRTRILGCISCSNLECGGISEG